MSRSLGAIDFLQQLVPDVLAVLIALLTQLGAIWFAGVVLLGVSLYHDREQAIVIGSLLIAGTSSWRFIKEVYVLPRPDQPLVDPETLPVVVQQLFELAVVNAGPGFPSGHAVTTTVLYFMLAMYLPVSTRLRRYLAATSLVALVGFTRITLGVHYLVDVVVGAMLGHTLVFAFLVVSRRTDGERAVVAITAAVVLATLNLGANLVVDPVNPRDPVLLLAAVGVYVWWRTRVVETVRPIPAGSVTND